MTPATSGVTASSAAAAQVGARILGRGGNAVDAAVATALASCVADPGNNGIGGYGGHMVIAPAGGEPMCVDFNMWLPAYWRPSDFRRIYANGNPEVTAVPNVIAGLARALERFGSMSWAEIVEPAVVLADAGVEANIPTARVLREIEHTSFRQECFALEATDRAGGLRFRQAALAETLDKLARYGPHWFYDGPVARGACEILGRAGSPITLREWADAPQAVSVAPASKLVLAPGTLFSAPLGTSGSASMFATVAAGAELAASGDLEAPQAIRAWALALAALWSYRFGTPHGNDFGAVDIADWTKRALAFSPVPAIPDSAGHTCHLNTCDRDGALVAVTLTHGQFLFGGRWAVPGTGVVMNAGMHLLTAADPIASNERFYAVTNMNPTVARLHDGAALAVGCPGARRIPTFVGLVLARHLFAGQSLQDAVSAGRFHAENSSSAAVEMDRWNTATVDALRSGFATVVDEDPRGPLTAIRREADGDISVGLDDRSWKGFASVGDAPGG